MRNIRFKDQKILYKQQLVLSFEMMETIFKTNKFRIFQNWSHHNWGGGGRL